MHSDLTPHTENMTPHKIYKPALHWYLGGDNGLFLKVRSMLSVKSCSSLLSKSLFFGLILLQQWHKISVLDLWSTNLSNAHLQPLTSHMAARNSPCMRKPHKASSHGAAYVEIVRVAGLPQLPLGGPMQGLMREHVSGRVDVGVCLLVWLCVCVCVCVCMCVYVAETGWVEW